MSKKLILHIGCHKTGTTSFQYWLKNNRIFLLDLGYHFSEIGTVEGCNNRPLVEDLYKNEIEKTVWKKLFEDLNNNPEKICILSSEDFSDLKEEEILKLHSLIYSYFDEVQIYFAARYPHFAVASTYGLLAKLGYTDANFSSFISKGYFGIDPFFHLQKFNYELILNRWIKIFGKTSINVFKYNENQNSVYEIIKFIGLLPELINSEQFNIHFRYNSMPSFNSILVLGICNRILSSCKNIDESICRSVASTIYGQAEKYYKDNPIKSNLFTPKIVRVLDDYYSDSISWLNFNFDLDFKLNHELFTNTVNEKSESLPFEEIVYWTNEVLNHLSYHLSKK